MGIEYHCDLCGEKTEETSVFGHYPSDQKYEDVIYPNLSNFGIKKIVCEKCGNRLREVIKNAIKMEYKNMKQEKKKVKA